MANPYFNHVNNRVEQGSRALDSQINNIADEVALGFDRLPTEAQLKENTTGFGVSTGTADALVVALPYVPTGGDGFNFFVRLNGTNSGGATLNVNSTGVKSIVNSDGSILTGGAMIDGTIGQFAYDLTLDRYILISNNSAWGKPSTSSQANSEFCPGFTYTFVSTTSWKVIAQNVTTVFAPARRCKFVKGGVVIYGTISTSVFSAGDTTMTMTMESGAILSSGITEVCITSGIDGWQLLAPDPFAGFAINQLAVGKIGLDVFWVAVGESSGGIGKIFTSTTKGVTWVERVPGTAPQGALFSVAFDPVAVGFIVGGENFDIFTSTDGTTWAGGPNAVLDAAFSGNNTGNVYYMRHDELAGHIVFAINSDGNAYISNGYNNGRTPDFGVTFTDVQGATSISDGVKAAGTYFVATGNTISNPHRGDFQQLKYDPPTPGLILVTLAVGEFWMGEMETSNTGGWCCLTSNGRVFFSLDADAEAIIDWSEATTNPMEGFQPEAIAKAEFLGDVLVCVGEGARIRLSADRGDTWSAISNGFSVSAIITSVQYSEDDLLWMAVNDVGEIATSISGSN